MKIHIIPSKEITQERIKKIIEQICSKPGPAQFEFQEYSVTWEKEDFISLKGINRVWRQACWA